MIGRTDQANHQYDLSDFYTALKDGNMPAVSFLKAAEYQDGHPGYSGPAGRADVPGEHHQPDRAVQVLGVHRDRRHLRRLRRLVRPPAPGDRERLQHRRGHGDLLLGADDRWAATPTGAATASGCRCWSSRPGPGRTTSATSLTNTVSIIKFIEDNWLHGQRIGGGSYDAISGSLDGPGGLLDFYTRPHFRPVILDPTTGRWSALAEQPAAPAAARTPRRRVRAQHGQQHHVSLGQIGL